MEQLRHRLPHLIDSEPEALEPTPQVGERCPYCRGGVGNGDLVIECNACKTHHHITCFGENRGCSTHGCGSQRGRSVRLGSTLPAHAKTVGCAHCQQPLEVGALVVRCACGRTLDVGCYEALGECGNALCQGSAELMTQREIRARNKRANAVALEVLTGILGAITLPFLVAAFFASRHDLPPTIIFGSLFFTLFVVTLISSRVVRRDARRLASAAPEVIPEVDKS